MTTIRPTFAALILAASTLSIVAAGAAQDGRATIPSEDDRTTTAPKTYPPYRRVPSNFGKIGLSTQQKEDIYAVRGRYQAEIGDLKRRIEELSKQEMEECEATLTTSQRSLLEQLRVASRPPTLGGSN